MDWKCLCVLWRWAQLTPSAVANELIKDSHWAGAHWNAWMFILYLSEDFHSISCGAGILELQKQWDEEDNALQNSPRGLLRRMEGAQSGPWGHKILVLQPQEPLSHCRTHRGSRNLQLNKEIDHQNLHLRGCWHHRQQCSNPRCAQSWAETRGQWGFSIWASGSNPSRSGWGMGWVLLEGLGDCLCSVLLVLEHCEPESASQIREELLPVPVVADFWNYDVTPKVILKIDLSLLLPCFVQFCILSFQRLQWIIYKAINLQVYFSFTKWFLERTYLHNAFLVVLR